MINAKIISFFLYLSFICIQPCTTFSQGFKKIENSFFIKGVSKVKVGKVALEYFDGKEAHFDTTRIRNGKFVFKGVLNEAGQAILSILNDQISETATTNNGRMKFYFVLEPIPLTVMLDTSNGLPDIRGTQVQEDYYRLSLKKYDIVKESNLLYDQFLDLISKQRAGDSSESLDRRITEISDTLKAYNVRNKGKLNRLETDFIDAHPASMVSAWMIFDNQNILPIDTVSFWYDKLTQDIKNSALGKGLGMRIKAKKGSEVGRQAPDFRGEDIEGNIVRLSDFAGNYVLLDFWASWCVPCREVTPQVIEFYKLYQPKLKLISISLDSREDAWKKAIKEDGMEGLVHLRENGNVRQKETDITFLYNIQPIPAFVLIDKKGKIIYRGKSTESVDEIKSLLQNIFKE